VKNERLILEQIVDCPFLASMAYAFQSADYLYIALKFEQGGEIFSILRQRPFSIFETKFYAAEMILAIEQLHKVI
jgi:serum/glucocorticoid-regulated kinase 2